MNKAIISLLGRGHVCVRLGSPLASVAKREMIARTFLAKASLVKVARQGERRKSEYPDCLSISQALLRGEERRAVFAYYRSVDWEWFSRVVRRLYLPAIVRNPRTMFHGSRSSFETTRRRVAAGEFDLAIALGETNPLEFAFFFSYGRAATEVYRILRTHAKTPKRWMRFGGLPEEPNDQTMQATAAPPGS